MSREVYEKSDDLVNHPNHYQGLKGLEVREVMDNFVPKYYQYSGLVACDIKDAIKYILRAPDKNGLEDLKKAQRMIKYVIDNWDGDMGRSLGTQGDSRPKKEYR